MLEGKIAVVTGASRGIGKAIALELAARGAEVIINYNGSAQSAGEVKKEIEEKGGKAETVQCNVADFSQCSEFISDVIKNYGRIDILVNNAGITRDGLLLRMKSEDLDRVLVFCNTKYNTAMICDMLTRQGIPAQCIHGDMIQKDRNRVMAKFKEGGIPVMVATDVAARGIDVTDIDAVINYDFPGDNETYVHRIGRTARARKEGISYLFYSADERARLKNLIRYTRFEISPVAVTEEGAIVPAEGL